MSMLGEPCPAVAAKIEVCGLNFDNVVGQVHPPRLTSSLLVRFNARYGVVPTVESQGNVGPQPTLREPHLAHLILLSIAAMSRDHPRAVASNVIDRGSSFDRWPHALQDTPKAYP